MPGMVLNDFNANVMPSKGLLNGFANGNGVALGVHPTPSSPNETLLQKFIKSFQELEAYTNGKPVLANGQTLSIAAVTAAARHGTRVVLDDSREVQEKVRKSRAVIAEKVDSGASVYGLSTGFGGSADTRTDKPLLLGHALLQHQHAGVLPSSDEPLEVLPLLDPGTSTTMPESWVRAAMLVRINSLIRGHSGVRWELIEKIKELLDAHITPAVPVRGSISASGDLSPLSYIAGSLVGNPSIRVFDGPKRFGQRKMVPSCDALRAHDIAPISLASKEHLGILNGTAFSAGVASLALNDAVHLALLAQVCTAMGTEALLGTSANYDPFLHDVTRPHPGQVEVAANIRNLLKGTQFAEDHEEEVKIDEDKYTLRQDRYPLRTSPQFLGPQVEDILAAFTAITQECNSTTDNPLVDGSTGVIHHGGNFQAMAVTNAMEKTRLSLHHIGKILFAQSTELVNPAMNNGLPPSMAATDPNLNYHTKGIDIATAAYVAELGYLATPVSTHVQSAEMHNQAVNSLALISARATLNSLEVLSMLTASYLYILCQALDLRALRKEFNVHFNEIMLEELQDAFGVSLSSHPTLINQLRKTTQETLDKSSTMDAGDQMRNVAASCSTALVDTLSADETMSTKLVSIPTFRAKFAQRAESILEMLRSQYLSGERSAAPAKAFLGKTRSVYSYIRETLGIRMHGVENYSSFAHGLGVDDPTIGQNISLIHESIRDGEMQKVVADLFV